MVADNKGVSEQLAAARDEPSWRWAVTVCFYAAHHLVHALCARYENELPPDRRDLVGARPTVVSFRHPELHGASDGGTRSSLALLGESHPDLAPGVLLLRIMLEQSYTARYGGELLFRPFVQGDATAALKRLATLESLISPHLR